MFVSHTDMAAELRAIEVIGTVDEAGHLSVDEPLRTIPPGRVRLIVFAPEHLREDDLRGDEPDEREWLAAANPSFDFLHGAAEDIYSIEDGRPFGPSVIAAR
jgi:hypothetical protein